MTFHDKCQQLCDVLKDKIGLHFKIADEGEHWAYIHAEAAGALTCCGQVNLHNLGKHSIGGRNGVFKVNGICQHVDQAAAEIFGE